MHLTFGIFYVIEQVNGVNTPIKNTAWQMATYHCSAKMLECCEVCSSRITGHHKFSVFLVKALLRGIPYYS